MQVPREKRSAFAGLINWFTTIVGRVFISLFTPAITFLVLWRVFLFLRDSDAPQILIVLVF